MKRLICVLFVLAFFIALVGALYAQENRPKELRTSAAIESDPVNWKTFTSSEGRFSVDFPGTPKLSTEEEETPSGKFTLNKCNVTTLAEYGVIYADFPTKIEGAEAANQILDNGAQAAVSQVKSKLLSMSNVTIDGNPGRLLKEQMRDGGIMYAKMILVGQRLYQVAITMPSYEQLIESQVATYEKAAHRFLNSFRLTR